MLKEKVPPLSKAIDLSHHLSHLAKARIESPLKNLQKYIERPGLISMAGGTLFNGMSSSTNEKYKIGAPDPLLFPFENIHIDALLPNTFAQKNSGSSSFFGWIWNMFRGTPKTERYTVSKFSAKPEEINLANALQYCSSLPISVFATIEKYFYIARATGVIQLQEFIRGFTKRVYDPAYSDWTTLAHCGNTDALVCLID